MKREHVKIIDIFAGPGGLSEGFSRFGEEDWSACLKEPVPKRDDQGRLPGRKKRNLPHRFDVALSVEMNDDAHKTLHLRALTRALRGGRGYSQYLEFLASGASDKARQDLITRDGAAQRKALGEALKATLGKVSETELDERIRKALGASYQTGRWVLIGGPPCQAYSLAGRSRNRGKEDYVAAKDHRHFLYREYLRLVAEHRPAVFVMENVKGLLSSTVDGVRMFDRILKDLMDPGDAIHGRKGSCPYSLRAVSVGDELPPGVNESLFSEDWDPREFIVRAELHGIPQARHRVILIGVRDQKPWVDPLTKRKLEPLPKRKFAPLPERTNVHVQDVLLDLPALRSGLSRGEDSLERWREAVAAVDQERWFGETSEKMTPDLWEEMRQAIAAIRRRPLERGSDVVERPAGSPLLYAHRWFRPEGFNFILNHSTRGHMPEDLHRYLFVACMAKTDKEKRSPTLDQFPEGLLPRHENAGRAISEGGNFGDRFRVQVAERPSTTVTSHISKDGHYYIHPDPAQCRSLTVREAARLQTFPDDYFFCGPRTEQYHQVGNAVPPLLATQIAGIVAELLG